MFNQSDRRTNGMKTEGKKKWTRKRIEKESCGKGDIVAAVHIYISHWTLCTKKFRVFFVDILLEMMRNQFNFKCIVYVFSYSPVSISLSRSLCWNSHLNIVFLCQELICHSFLWVLRNSMPISIPHRGPFNWLRTHRMSSRKSFFKMCDMLIVFWFLKPVSYRQFAQKLQLANFCAINSRSPLRVCIFNWKVQEKKKTDDRKQKKQEMTDCNQFHDDWIFFSIVNSTSASLNEW